MLVYECVVPGTSVPDSPLDAELSPEVQEHLDDAEAGINNEIRAYSERYIIPHSHPQSHSKCLQTSSSRGGIQGTQNAETGGISLMEP